MRPKESTATTIPTKTQAANSWYVLRIRILLVSFRTLPVILDAYKDKPKTLGLAIFCPIRLDEEVGPHIFKSKMEDGSYCFPLAQFPVEVEMHLRPTDFNPNDTTTNKAEIISEFITTPAKERKLQVQALRDSGAERPHAVCTVQSFKNMFTGKCPIYLFQLLIE